jgi:6-phosphogluconolactonase (cycloisomerase 2 family)
MRKKAAAALLMCASMAIWAGCGKTSSRFLYAATPGANEIVIFREDPNAGVLTQLAGSPVTAGLGVESLVLHPSKKFMYAANSGSDNISLFTIASTGAITEVTPRVDVGTAPTLMVIDSAGKYLYVGNSGSSDISVFSIDASTGALTPVPQGSGQLTVTIGMTPLKMQLAPSGNILYVTGQTVTGIIQAFSVNAGVFSNQPIAGSPYMTGNAPYGLAINSSGTFLYTANTIDSSISEFKIKSDGSLTALAGSPIGQTGTGPTALLIDNSGKYMYVANNTNLQAYAVGSDGSLTLNSNSQFGTAAQPNTLASDPSGKYLFVGSPSAIQSLSLDGSSGTLTSVATYAVSTSATSIVVTP